MRNKYVKPILFVFLAGLFFSAVPGLLNASTVSIPGDVNAISFYTKFFYNLPADDFLYYLNDRLLFSEDPDERVFAGGLRARMINVLLVHDRIKEFLKEINPKDPGRVTLDLKTPEGVDNAVKLIGLLGLHLEIEKGKKFQIYVDESKGVIDYYKFAMLDINSMVKQMNNAGLLHFKLLESDIAFPWDLRFIGEITGLSLTPDTFFANLLVDERLSLFLGVLYRLSSLEVGYLSNLIKNPHLGAWKRIYRDKQFLMGLFLLAPALRVVDGRMQLPGGQKAEIFWSDLVGEDYPAYPLEFIEKLVTQEDGKYNMLYLFSFFLPEESRRAIFFDYDSIKVRDLLDNLTLLKEEKGSISVFPKLNDFNFYTMLFALRNKDGKILLPGGTLPWMKAVLGPDFKLSGQEGGKTNLEPDLWIELLKRSNEKGKKMTALKKFLSLYTKFYDRPGLLTEEVLPVLYSKYESHNVLVDFIEKIPIKKPGTVISLFKWADSFRGINKKDRSMFIGIFQSLLEVFSQAAIYAPTNFDYDRVVTAMTRIPMNKLTITDDLFSFLESELSIDLGPETLDESILNFLLSGVGNPTVRVRDLDYKFMAKELYRDLIIEIQQSQEILPLATLYMVNRLLSEIAEGKGLKDPGLSERIKEAFVLLPQPDIGNGAPQVIKDRVIVYSQEALKSDVDDLVNKITGGASLEKLKSMVTKIKSKYLVTHVKDYFLSLAYALNAKNGGLRLFINPNLIRLHDFENRRELTPWNFCGRPQSKFVPKAGTGIFGNKEKTAFSGYYLQGGLSRMNILFAAIWKEQIFGRNVIFDSDHVQGFIANLMDFYPVPRVSQSQAYSALLVEFAVEMIQKAGKNKELGKELRTILGKVTTGYHYREICSYLDGRSKDYYLFFHELMALGETCFKEHKFVDIFSNKKQLEVFYGQSMAAVIKKDLNRFGSIFYHTYGNLVPIRLHMFPQELTNFLNSGWTSGEMIDEFKIKIAFNAQKKRIPPSLMGVVLYHYLTETSRRFYSQNYKKDYFSTYFIFDIFNNSYMNRIIKKSQQKGYLRIK